ncbi:unnamed protein product, partial [Staurois parvus]
NKQTKYFRDWDRGQQAATYHGQVASGKQAATYHWAGASGTQRDSSHGVWPQHSFPPSFLGDIGFTGTQQVSDGSIEHLRGTTGSYTPACHQDTGGQCTQQGQYQDMGVSVRTAGTVQDTGVQCAQRGQFRTRVGHVRTAGTVQDTGGQCAHSGDSTGHGVVSAHSGDRTRVVSAHSGGTGQRVVSAHSGDRTRVVSAHGAGTGHGWSVRTAGTGH